MSFTLSIVRSRVLKLAVPFAVGWISLPTLEKTPAQQFLTGNVSCLSGMPLLCATDRHSKLIIWTTEQIFKIRHQIRQIPIFIYL